MDAAWEAAAASQQQQDALAAAAADAEHIAAMDSGPGVGLGRVVRWASCGDELVSRQHSNRSPFAGFSVDSEVPLAAAARKVSTATNPGLGFEPFSGPQQQQRQTDAGFFVLTDLAHSIAPACTDAADLLAQRPSLDGAPGDANEGLGPASKAASRDGGSSDAEGGDQQLGSFDLFPPLLQPAAGTDRGPEMAIIKILDELPPDESAHLSCKGKRAGCRAAAEASRGVTGAAVTAASGAQAAFKFYFGFLAEGTMAIEVRFTTGNRVLLKWISSAATKFSCLCGHI
jgi:hypothetical protein